MRKATVWAFLACLIVSPAVFANCSFAFLSEIRTNAGTNPGDVASGDFNHDGFDDLAIVNRQSKNIAILLGQQGGTFTEPAFVQTSGSTQAGIAAAHINGDGHLDLIVTGGEVTSGGITYSGMDVQVLIGNGAGGFSLGDKEWIGYHPSDFAAGDFDNDGDTDFAVSRTGNNPASVHLIVNLGGGNIAQKSDTPVLTGPGAGSWLRGIASGDFDGDGNLDVVASDSVSNKAWIFYGKGDGTFHSPTTTITPTTETGHGAGQVASADFNGDGFDDLAVANEITGSGITVTPTFVVSLSNGANRTFGAPVSYGTVSGAQKALAHDMNGDGHADVVVTGSSTIYIFLGAGDGTFSVRNAGTGGLGLAVLDVDNDGGADLATTHFSAGKAGILQNMCGSVTLSLTSSANPGSKGTPITITASLSATPAATGTLTLTQTGGGTLGSTNLSAATSVSSTQSLEIGTYEFVATYSGDARYPATTRTLVQTVQAPPFGPPPAFNATSSGGSVQLSWVATSDTYHYEVFRNTGSGFVSLGTTPSPAYDDATAPANSAVLYKVRAINASLIASAFPATDVTTTHVYTDPTITAGVHVAKRAHLTELRHAADGVRVLAGLSPASWTDAVPTVIRGVHMSELRTAINEARAALGLAASPFDGSNLIRALHVNEARAALR